MNQRIAVVLAIGAIIAALGAAAATAAPPQQTAFTIDDTFPTVTARTPPPGQTGVPVNADVVVTFSEGMDRPSVQTAFSMSAGGAPSFGWAGNTMTVSHATPFPAGQSVSVTIGTGRPCGLTQCDARSMPKYS